MTQDLVIDDLHVGGALDHDARIRGDIGICRAVNDQVLDARAVGAYDVERGLHDVKPLELTIVSRCVGGLQNGLQRNGNVSLCKVIVIFL